MTKSNKRGKLKEDFRNKLLKHIKLFNKAVSTKNGDY